MREFVRAVFVLLKRILNPFLASILNTSQLCKKWRENVSSIHPPLYQSLFQIGEKKRWILHMPSFLWSRAEFLTDISEYTFTHPPVNPQATLWLHELPPLQLCDLMSCHFCSFVTWWAACFAAWDQKLSESGHSDAPGEHLTLWLPCALCDSFSCSGAMLHVETLDQSADSQSLGALARDESGERENITFYITINMTTLWSGSYVFVFFDSIRSSWISTLSALCLTLLASLC